MADPHAWRDRAACKGEDTALFYGPGEGEPRETPKRKLRRVEKAKDICRRCPVTTECLTHHLWISPQQYGVAGGLDEDERTTLRRRLQRRNREERKAS